MRKREGGGRKVEVVELDLEWLQADWSHRELAVVSRAKKKSLNRARETLY